MKTREEVTIDALKICRGAVARPVQEQWIIVKETAVDVGQNRPELGYTFLHNPRIFESSSAASNAMKEANLPPGFVYGKLSQFIPDLFSQPAPTAQPKQDAVLAEPVAYLDNRYGKDYRGLHFPPKDTWMEGFIPLYTHPPAPPNPADEVFAVYHSEQYVGNFKQALFTTEKKAQAYIDAQTKRLGEEIFIEVMKLDAVIALKTNTPAQEGNQ